MLYLTYLNSLPSFCRRRFLMPRKARHLIQGEYYHVLARGNNRQTLFRCEADRQFYLEALLNYKVKFSVAIFHYCLMGNHVHLLMRSDEANDGIRRIIHGLHTSYAHYYHRATVGTGHVFEDRFRSFHIESEAYLLECGRYIERNPVRAGMVKQPGHYPWSSFRFYAEDRPDPVVTPNPLYLNMGLRSQDRHAAYREYVCVERAYETVVDRYFDERVLP